MPLGGSLNMELLMNDATYCRINDLHSDGLNFQQGKIDVFVGADLGDCGNFTAPGGEIARLSLTHRKELNLNLHLQLSFNHVSRG